MRMKMAERSKSFSNRVNSPNLFLDDSRWTINLKFIMLDYRTEALLGPSVFVFIFRIDKNISDERIYSSPCLCANPKLVTECSILYMGQKEILWSRWPGNVGTVTPELEARQLQKHSSWDPIFANDECNEDNTTFSQSVAPLFIYIARAQLNEPWTELMIRSR